MRFSGRSCRWVGLGNPGGHADGEHHVREVDVGRRSVMLRLMPPQKARSMNLD